MDKQEMIFVPMNFQEVPPTAPETVRGRVSFDVDKMIAFLQEHRNEKGYVNTKMMKSKATNKIYYILDTYKKPETPVQEPTSPVERTLPTETTNVPVGTYKVSESGKVTGVPDPVDYPENDIMMEDLPF